MAAIIAIIVPTILLRVIVASGALAFVARAASILSFVSPYCRARLGSVPAHHQQLVPTQQGAPADRSVVLEWHMNAMIS